jgi:hypothetical protein
MTTRQKINDWAEMVESQVLLLDPPVFDEAILGIAERADGMTVVAYDRMECIRILMRDGMNRDEAEEYFEFNTIGAWMGEGTPVFIDTRYAE